MPISITYTKSTIERIEIFTNKDMRVYCHLADASDANAKGSVALTVAYSSLSAGDKTTIDNLITLAQGKCNTDGGI